MNKLINRLKDVYENLGLRSNTFRVPENYNEAAESFANSNNFPSATGYFIWVDKKNFRTNIYKGYSHHWSLLNSYVCTIGKPSTPTPNGNFKIGIKGLYFGVEKGYKARYYTQFYGNYLFHSILYNLNGTVRDGRLGMALSDGCVRLSLDHAKWIWDNIPQGTSVHIS